MTPYLNRRLLCSYSVALTLCATNSMAAEQKRGLDGTWGGAQNGVTAQVIIVGVKVIGFFWRNDYLDVQSPKFSSNGERLSFAFRDGNAVLTRSGDRAATIDISEGGNVTHIDLKRD